MSTILHSLLWNQSLGIMFFGFVEKLPKLPEGRRGHACGALPNGDFVVAGGQAGWNQGGSLFSTVVTLSPGSSAWTSLSELPRRLKGIHASIVGGRLRIVGRSEVFEYRDTTWSKVGDLQINRLNHNVQTLRPIMQPCLSDYKFLQPVTARLSSTLPGYAASKCIDGDEISVPHGTSLCHSWGASAPWLAVDYVASVSIRWVEIFNRRDCCGDRTKNVNVRVSDDLPTTDKQMFSGGALLGHFAGPGSDEQHIVISGG